MRWIPFRFFFKSIQEDIPLEELVDELGDSKIKSQKQFDYLLLVLKRT